ncbi:MAG: DUF1802 family protein [Acidimicrobiia bacterium]|nr:DUF1802 family protein [Acidimicrobiia bacterium]
MGTPALRIWPAVAHALLQGEQVVALLPAGAGVPPDRLWLLPTATGQSVELLKPAYRRWAETAEPSGTAPGWAEVVDVAEVDEPSVLDALDAKTVRSTADPAALLPARVLVLRVHQAHGPPSVAAAPGGVSIVEVEGLAAPGSTPGEPVLSDVAFEARRKGVEDSLSAARASA